MGSGSIEGLSQPAEPLEYADAQPDPTGQVAYRQELAFWLQMLVPGVVVFLLGLFASIELLVRVGCLLGGGAFAAYSGFRVCRHVQHRDEWAQDSLLEDLGI